MQDHSQSTMQGRTYVDFLLMMEEKETKYTYRLPRLIVVMFGTLETRFNMSTPRCGAEPVTQTQR